MFTKKLKQKITIILSTLLLTSSITFLESEKLSEKIIANLEQNQKQLEAIISKQKEIGLKINNELKTTQEENNKLREERSEYRASKTQTPEETTKLLNKQTEIDNKIKKFQDKKEKYEKAKKIGKDYCKLSKTRLDSLKDTSLIFKQTEEECNLNETFLDNESWNDLNLFYNSQNPLKTWFYEIEQKDYPTICSLELAKQLANPPKYIQTLEQNKKIIQTLVNDKNLLENLDKLLKEFKNVEKAYINYYTKFAKKALEQQASNPNWFKRKWGAFKTRTSYYTSHKTEFFTKFAPGMMHKTLFSILPISQATYSYFLDPIQTQVISYWSPTFYLALGLKMFSSNTITPILFMYMFGVPIYEFFYLAVPFYGVKISYSLSKMLWDKYKDNKEAKTLLAQIDKISEIFNQIKNEIEKDEELKTLISEDKNDTEKKNIFTTIGKIGAYVSLAKKVIETNWCLVDYEPNNSHVHIKFNDFFNMITANKENVEDIEFTSSNISHIQPPQQLKNIGIATLLAHLGIAPAQYTTITPLSYIEIWTPKKDIDLNRETNKACMINKKMENNNFSLVLVDKKNLDELYKQNDTTYAAYNGIFKILYDNLQKITTTLSIFTQDPQNPALG